MLEFTLTLAGVVILYALKLRGLVWRGSIALQTLLITLLQKFSRHHDNEICVVPCLRAQLVIR